jgi:hypothetical protein
VSEVIRLWNWEEGHWFGLNEDRGLSSFGGNWVGDDCIGERASRIAAIERNVSFMGARLESGFAGLAKIGFGIIS